MCIRVTSSCSSDFKLEIYTILSPYCSRVTHQLPPLKPSSATRISNSTMTYTGSRQPRQTPSTVVRQTSHCVFHRCERFIYEQYTEIIFLFLPEGNVGYLYTTVLGVRSDDRWPLAYQYLRPLTRRKTALLQKMLHLFITYVQRTKSCMFFSCMFYYFWWIDNVIVRPNWHTMDTFKCFVAVENEIWRKEARGST